MEDRWNGLGVKERLSKAWIRREKGRKKKVGTYVQVYKISQRVYCFPSTELGWGAGIGKDGNVILA